MHLYTLKKWALSLLFTVAIASLSNAHFGARTPFGGSVSCATVNDSIIYIGTPEGGVYLSNNTNLTSWTARPVGLKSGKITALAHTGSYLFAGTADSGVFIFNGAIGSDLYWNKVNKGLTNLKVTSLVALDSITLMAGTDGGGIFLTVDKGANWTAVNNHDLHHLDITGLVKAGNRIISIAHEGSWASDDKGATWFDFNDDHTLHVDGTTALSYNAVTNQLMLVNDDSVYVAGSASTTLDPSYASAETGLPADAMVYSIANDGVSWYLATSKGVFISPAGGAISLTPINTGLPAVHVTTIVPYSSKGKKALVCGTIGEGIYKSPNPFTTWSLHISGFNNLRTFAHTTSGPKMVVVANEKGVFVSGSVGAANSFVRRNKGLTDSLQVNDILFADFCILAATKAGGVFFTPDTGKTWTAINGGLSSMNALKLFYSNFKKYVICADGMVYSSDLHGSSWTSIQHNLPVGVKPTSLGFVGKKLVLTTNGAGVFVKTLDGTNWVQSNTGLSNLDVTSVTASDSKIFVGTHGNGVFVSDTTTISWSNAAPVTISHTVTMGLDGSKIQAMFFDKGWVFASYRGGLLATSDNGATWIAGGNQFNLPSFADVFKISVTEKDGTTAGRVFVTTPNNGPYSNSLSELPAITTGLADDAMNASDMFVSPNPNKGSFQLHVSSNMSKVTEVTVFDAVGKKVDTLSVGVSSFTVNYPNGIYFVQVRTANNEVRTQKMVIE